VRAYYPGDDWYVTGADKADAITSCTLSSTAVLRIPDNVAQQFARAKNHLYGSEVTPGFEVETIS
jgi:hypothetical protein